MTSIQIINDNLELETLRRSWATAVYSSHDGLAPMGSLHEAGDALVALAQLEDGTTTILGSGVMIGPGLVIAATHVLEEFKARQIKPVLLTFLPDGVRAWLPREQSSVSGPSAFGEDRKIMSDVTLLSCTLNSESHSQHPLTLCPMQIALPLQGERLWAFGYRHEALDGNAALISPLVASGIVTAVFPMGRGERMRSACVEIAMDTKGGMSGGPVINADGDLVGIVSSSFDGGPSYVTLIWEALRYKFVSRLPSMSNWGEISLFSARSLGLVKFKGNVKRSKIGNISMTLSEAEMELMLASTDPAAISYAPPGSYPLKGGELDSFEEERLSEIESAASESALAYLRGLSLPHARAFLSASGALEECLSLIQKFSVEDFEGVEDPDIQSARRDENGNVEIDIAFDLLSIRWTVEVPTQDYLANDVAFDASFLNPEVCGSTTSMELYQRCHFEAKLTLNPKGTEFVDSHVTFSGVICPKPNGRGKRIVSWITDS